MLQDRQSHRPMKMNTNTMVMENDGETTTLDSSKYPQLEGAAVGQFVKGVWEGKVTANDNGQVTIQYDSLDLETENSADKSLAEMKGKKQNVQPDEGEQEDYA